MEATTIQCKACGNQFTGKYCNNCGEKVYTQHDKTVLHFVEEGFHFVTHFEGTFFTTLKYIFTQPGRLSELYCSGIRKALFKPISLFLLLVVIYLFFPKFEGLNQRLYYHTTAWFYGDWATEKAKLVMLKNQWTDAQLSQAFHEKSEKVSKLLLLILLPLTALFFWALTFKKRPYFFDQMVFATEINCMYIIWNFMILPLFVTITIFLVRKTTGTVPMIGDWEMAPLHLLDLVYVAIASRRFYRIKWWQSAGLAVLFFFAHFFIVQLIYKFLLFAICIYQL